MLVFKGVLFVFATFVLFLSILKYMKYVKKTIDTLFFLKTCVTEWFDFIKL